MSDIPNWLISAIEIIGGGMFLFVSYFVTATMREIRDTMKDIRAEQAHDREIQLKLAEKVNTIDKVVEVHEYRIKDFVKYSDSTNETLKLANEMVSKLKVMYTDR